MKFVIILAFLVALTSSISGQGSQNYCGRYLADTLAYMCQNVGEEVAEKRSGAMAAASLYGTRGWRWATLGGARGKRGVIDECCYQSCTLNELLTYC